MKRLLVPVVMMLFLAIDSVGQLPPQTVVFKVRKARDTINTVREITIVSEESGVWFVEENATFRGGDLNNFVNWVKQRILYPAKAIEKGLAGTVFVQFSVDKNGEVCDVRIVRSVHPLLDDEVKRAIQSSPRWSPARQSGTAVKQNFVIPVAFSMQ
jgi:periplasmic protein TonB